jgi:hypothetical protein
MEIEYILLIIFILVICYFVFFKRDTFINRKLENFEGDDLNIHKDDDLNIINDLNL